MFSPEKDLNALGKAGRQPTADKSLAIISLPQSLRLHSQHSDTRSRGDTPDLTDTILESSRIHRVNPAHRTSYTQEKRRAPAQDTDTNSAKMATEEVQISCKFVTRLPEQYRIAPTPIAVPGKLTRYGLSEVINHLLSLDPPKPFDFLVQGELVRTSLEKLVVRRNISAESALEVEYIPAVAPPSEEATGMHEDWVSAVDGSWAAAVATGCYDGTARLWTPGGAQIISLGTLITQFSNYHTGN